MPPKGKAPAADKSKQKAKEKLVEDKTFGLKNKGKSAKVQKYVQQLQKSAQPQRNPRLDGPSIKDKKQAEEARKKELADLFAMAIKQPKVPAGVDPKSIVCEFFRHGQCTKGFKCKFAHDLSVERKTQKADLFTDRRDDEKDEGMEDWDQETLEKAIAQKHAAENKNRPTEIICKFFLEAVEKRLYGWFWQCPNGKECKYRHALPPGYVLKSQMKELLELEAANRVSVEEAIEEERAKVEAKTPITQETFEAWMKAKEEARQKAADEKEAERRKKGTLTGREIFLEEGFVAQDDVSASDAIERDRTQEEAEIKRMEQQAAEALQQAREASAAAAGAAPAEAAAAAAGSGAGGASGSGAGGGGVATTLQLSAAEAEELFEGTRRLGTSCAVRRPPPRPPPRPIQISGCASASHRSATTQLAARPTQASPKPCLPRPLPPARCRPPCTPAGQLPRLSAAPRPCGYPAMKSARFLAAAAALLLATLAAHPAAAARSLLAKAPTKAPIANPPMFILFSHDDGVSSEDLKAVLAVSDQHKNPNGCRVPVTWFACTHGCPFDCASARKVYSKGHELGDHTVDHKDLRKLSYAAVQQQIVGARTAIAACGIPAASIVGFRSPYLSDSPTVRQVLSDAGFRYDSSIGQDGGAARPWPTKVAGGMPYDCEVAGNQCSKSESYPSLYEVPLYGYPGGNTMDPCTNENTGAKKSSCSAYTQLKGAFDAAYTGNRGPFEISIHTPFLQDAQFAADTSRFLDYALSQPDVWAVTFSQFLDWLEKPVPASGMAAFMSKYTCDK